MSLQRRRISSSDISGLFWYRSFVVFLHVFYVLDFQNPSALVVKTRRKVENLCVQSNTYARRVPSRPQITNRTNNKQKRQQQQTTQISAQYISWVVQSAASGAKKLANAHPIALDESRHSNRQSSPSSTYSGNLGCVLGCPASCSTPNIACSSSAKNGKPKYETAEGGVHGCTTRHEYCVGAASQVERRALKSSSRTGGGAGDDRVLLRWRLSEPDRDQPLPEQPAGR